MDPNLYQAARQLPPGDARVAQLHALAMSPGTPQALESRIRTGLLLVAALLLGSGLIFWIAANWQEQSRLFRLGLIEGALAVALLVACLWPRMRLAALFCATLVLGGLLAFVGQTYQTGADAWQLFAMWAGLALVWVALSRSDLLWALWVLIAAAGIVMWTGRIDLWEVMFERQSSPTQMLLNLALWLPLAVLPALLSLIPALRVNDGMGWWSHRVALGCALTAWAGIGVTQMLATRGHVSLLVFAAAAALVGMTLYLSLQGRFQDFVSACLATLAGNALVLVLVGRWLAEGAGIEALLFFGLIALGCLGGSVRWLMHIQQGMWAQTLGQGRVQEVAP